MFRSMAYPTNYIQEPGVLKECGFWIKKFGSRPLIVAGPTAWSKAGEQIALSLKEAEVDYQIEFFAGHCSDEELERLQSKADPNIDIIIGVGGGQCLDTAKLMGIILNLPIVTVSTLASTCAATTPLSVVYTPDHEFVRTEYYDRCPILTLVDPNIILKAPVRYLVSGIADTLVKWYEAFPINQGKFQNTKTKAGLKIAELARDLLFESSEQAIHECQTGQLGHALREVIDTNILLGGLVGGLGSDTCRASGAHPIHYGMTLIPEMKHAYHGELVAFGLLCQLTLEGKTEEEITNLMGFYQRINLPINLFELKMTEVREADLDRAAKKVYDQEEIHFLPVTISEEMIKKAIIKTHQLGEKVAVKKVSGL